MDKNLGKNHREILYILFFLLIYFISHFIIWLYASSFKLQVFISIFQNWDAAIYNAISSGFYDKETISSNLSFSFPMWPACFAFFPMWPACLWILGHITGFQSETSYALLGAGLSTFIFILFVIIVYKIKSLPNEMKPQTWFGWFLLIFSPASYIFHTNHTEALFLMVSWLAFLYAIQGKMKTSSVLAGFCALIKNQGIITAFVIGLIMAVMKGKNLKEKLIYFIYSGLISGSIFSFWLIFQYIKTGDPFTFIHVQENWQHAKGLIDYLYTWIYNFRYVVQLINGPRSLRAILFYVGIAVSIYLIFYKKNTILQEGKKINLSRFFGIYIFLCSAIIPLQGYLENTFRFNLILFPLWFILGDIVYNYIKSIKSGFISNSLKFLSVSLILILNFWMTYLYGKNLWSY
jgi:hypothetical protein